MLNKYLPQSFNEFLIIENEAHNQYKKYLKGEGSLDRAVLPHPTGDDIFDYIKSKTDKTFWMTDPDRLSKNLSKRRSN